MKDQLFKTVCAWCGAAMGERRERVEDEAPAVVGSHGVCKKCYRKMVRELPSLDPPERGVIVIPQE